MHRLALGTGQTVIIIMAVVGAGGLYRSSLRRLGRLTGSADWGLAAAAPSGHLQTGPPLLHPTAGKGGHSETAASTRTVTT